MEYNSKLEINEQISAEERIAAIIFDYEPEHGEYHRPDENDCAELGRRILRRILQQFRPDLTGEDKKNGYHNETPETCENCHYIIHPGHGLQTPCEEWVHEHAIAEDLEPCYADHMQHCSLCGVE